MVIIANITLFICSIALSMFIYRKINSIIDEHNKLEAFSAKFSGDLKRKKPN